MLEAGLETRPGQSITTTRTMGANHMSAGRRPPGIISTKPTPKRVVMRLAKTTISTTATSKARLYSRTNTMMKCRPSRRRVGVMAIAGVFALALIGTAGAFRLSRPLWLVWVATAAACYRKRILGPAKLSRRRAAKIHNQIS